MIVFDGKEHRRAMTHAPELICGDCLDVLPTLPERSVQCVMTSPPYFALRSYLPAGHPDKAKEIGSEPTPEAFIATMVDVFREVRRVLRDDGVLFLNLGDVYGRGTRPNWRGDADRDKHGLQSNICYEGNYAPGRVLDDGQLQNLPHRVAEALRADGWIWRQTIVWAKKSPMPESVAGWRWVRCRVKVKAGNRDPATRKGGPENSGSHAGFDARWYGGDGCKWTDCPGCPKCRDHGGYVLRRGSGRCTTAHEYVFVMAKGNPYFWDSVASAEEATSTGGGACVGASGNADAGARRVSREENASIRGGTRNPRTVWTLSSEPTKVRHFATFPSELVRRCLVAGISAGGCCRECGAPFAPVVESKRHFESGSGRSGRDPVGKNGRKLQGGGETGDIRRGPCVSTRCHGYRPTCECGEPDPIGCVVLDPFSGIGTVAQTARELGCRFIGIELNPEYHAVAERRVLEPPRWLLRQKTKGKKPKPTTDAPLLAGME